MIVEFTVFGEALPQGSKSARVVNSRAILTEGFGEQPKRRKQWRDAVADGARLWAKEHPGGMLDEALTLTVVFYLPRPKLPKRYVRPTKKPDLGKLVRSVEDSLTNILVADDARFVSVWAQKFYSTPDISPCAVIRIEQAGVDAPLLLPYAKERP